LLTIQLCELHELHELHELSERVGLSLGRSPRELPPGPSR